MSFERVPAPFQTRERNTTDPVHVTRVEAVRACTAPRGTPARQLLLAPVPVSADAPWLSASLRPRAAQAEFEAWLVPHIHAITDLPGFGKAIVYEARQRASLLI